MFTKLCVAELAARCLLDVRSWLYESCQETCGNKNHLKLPHQGAWRKVASDSALVCFDGALTEMTNPGCFSVPGSSGDCTAARSHFVIQVFFPESPGPFRVRHMAFVSVDMSIVFPSAGVIVLPNTPQDPVRFPTPEELANLQARDVGATDFDVFQVDLQEHDIWFDGTNAIAVCVQFPAGSLASGEGPGIAADVTSDSETPCRHDYFTVTAGHGEWWRPADDHVDWGFELLVETPTSVQSRGWGVVKRLYR